MPEHRSPKAPVAGICAAQVLLECSELQPMLDFFIDRLGFRLERIAPADDPRMALVCGYGLQVSLRRGEAALPGSLLLLCDDPALLAAEPLCAPNGTRIEFAPATPELVIPRAPQQLVVSRAADASWVRGRAGMGYRDLIPGRLGGRFIASLIRIAEGGPVPDQVHFHSIRFQMIFCTKGWVRVVYEDQGPPILLTAGDCFMQPAHIRHRVLESSPGLEVVELACPAEHDTMIDHALELPNDTLAPDRDFGGQRFVHHVAEEAAWRVSSLPGFEQRDTGIAEATRGLAGARVLRPRGPSRDVCPWRHDGEFLFAYVMTGELEVAGAGTSTLQLGVGDSIVLPAGRDCSIRATSDDLEWLEVTLPGPNQ